MHLNKCKLDFFYLTSELIKSIESFTKIKMALNQFTRIILELNHRSTNLLKWSSYSVRRSPDNSNHEFFHTNTLFFSLNRVDCASIRLDTLRMTTKNLRKSYLVNFFSLFKQDLDYLFLTKQKSAKRWKLILKVHKK